MTRGRGCAIGCALLVLMPVAAIAALSFAYSEPSYEDVTASFAAHPAEFETLRQMVQQDGADCVPSGRSFRKFSFGLHYEGGVYDRSSCRTIPSGDRLAEYQRRMRAVNIGVVIQRRGDTLVFVSRSALFGGGLGFGAAEHGVMYSSKPPQSFSNDMKRQTITPASDGWYFYRTSVDE